MSLRHIIINHMIWFDVADPDLVALAQCWSNLRACCIASSHRIAHTHSTQLTVECHLLTVTGQPAIPRSCSTKTFRSEAISDSISIGDALKWNPLHNTLVVLLSERQNNFVSAGSSSRNPRPNHKFRIDTFHIVLLFQASGQLKP
jgi:hypothetical protein